MKNHIVAIDGPVGSGKSTVAKEVAKKLGYIYLDTGAMYRCVALKWIADCGLEEIKKHQDEIVRIAKSCDIKLTQDGNVFLDGRDVSNEIRTPQVSNLASSVSALKGVREVLWQKQREIGKGGHLVAEGRDVGTVVFPQAEIKIFLTASLKERAKRRYLELKEKGLNIDFEGLKKEIEIRDRQDLTRDTAPLRKADDAVEIDTDGMAVSEVVDEILKIVNSVSCA